MAREKNEKVAEAEAAIEPVVDPEPEEIAPEEVTEAVADEFTPDAEDAEVEESEAEKANSFYARRHDGPLIPDAEIIAMGYKAGDVAMFSQEFQPQQWGASRPEREDHPAFTRGHVIVSSAE